MWIAAGWCLPTPTAALAIAKRKGAGKLRHINISCLWIQEKCNTNELDMRKVRGTENPADMMTKHLPRHPLEKCMGHLNQCHVARRAKAGLDDQGSKSARERPGGATSGLSGVRSGTPTRAIGTVHADDKRANPRRARFLRPTVIQFQNWKAETKALCHIPSPCAPPSRRLMKEVATHTPSRARSSNRLGSLTECHQVHPSTVPAPSGGSVAGDDLWRPAAGSPDPAGAGGAVIVKEYFEVDKNIIASGRGWLGAGASRVVLRDSEEYHRAEFEYYNKARP